MAERILAIDPGEKVGWAVGEVNDTAAGGKYLRVIDHGIHHLKPFALKLHDALAPDDGIDYARYDTVVMESYRISSKTEKCLAHKGSDVPTLQLVGMIRMCCWLAPGVTLVTQGPRIKSQAELTKPQWLAEKLAGLPSRHDEAHDGDALLHLWHFFFKHHFDPTKEGL